MQIAFRILGPGIPVFDFTAGEIVDGQFKAFEDLRGSLDALIPGLSNLVHFDNLLGTQAYVKSQSLGAAVTLVTAHSDFAGMQFYPNFLVFEISDHVKTKEKDA